MKFTSTVRQTNGWIADLPYGLQSIAFGTIATTTYVVAKFSFALSGIYFEGTHISGLYAGLAATIAHFILSPRELI